MQGEASDPHGLTARIGDIEEAYEFMLAYAAQGHMRGTEGDHIRRFLTQADDALDGLPAEARAAVKRVGVDEAAYRPFLDALDQDVGRARAGIALALAQRAIASQLVDNLNASIHLRTLLTDLFLLDEALASHRA